MKRIVLAGLVLTMLSPWVTVLASPEVADTVAGAVGGNTVVAPPVASGRIVFYSSRYSSYYDICSMNPDGTGLARLTSTSDYDWYPSYSPNGKKIVFSRGMDTQSADIYVMNSDGSGLVRLSSTVSRLNTSPRWSPDGTKIVYTSKTSSNLDSNSDVWVMSSADGSSPAQLTLDTGSDSTPAWSPDGTRIAWRATRAGDNQIWLMNSTDGSNPVQLTSEASGAHTPSWSPDGTHIAYNSGNNICIIKTDGTGRTQLTSTGKDYSPCWSPDGTKVTFMSMRNNYRDIYTMNADGSSVIQLTSDTALDDAPSWQPAYPPSIDTLPATGVSFTSATLNGNLPDSGTAISCNVSFEWWSDPANKHYTTSVIKIAPCTFTANLTGLSEGVTYSFRAKAAGTATSYGEEATFTTDDSSIVRLNINETLFFTDFPALYPPASLTVNETFPFNDVQGIVTPAILTINEILAFSDTPLVTPPAQLSVFEAFSILDAPLAIPTITLTVNEAFIFADTPSLFPPVALKVTESFAVSDNQDLTPPTILLVNETLSFSDTPAISKPVILDVTETIIVSESPRFFPPVSLVINEMVHTNDFPSLLLPVYLTISETISTSDSPVLLPPICLTVAETVSTMDRPGVLPPASLTLNEIISAVDIPAAGLKIPVIIAASPAAGSTGIGYRQTISVTFSKPMDHLSAENAFSISPAVSGDFTWTGNTMMFTPLADMPQGATHTVTISTLASDLEPPGNHLEQAFIFSFSTQSGCFIFTAAYGSPLAREVTLLQDFRAGAGMSSGTGQGFFHIFNSIYYSFSPQVAGFISSAEPLRSIARVLLTPLVWTADISTHTATMLGAFNAELGMLLSLVLAGALAGIIYVSPVLLAACTIPNRYRRIKSGKRMRAIETALLISLLVSVVLWGEGMNGTGSFTAAVAACGLASFLVTHVMHNYLMGKIKT